MAGAPFREKVEAYRESTSLTSLRKETYEIFHPSVDEGWKRFVDFFIMTLIAVNVAAVMLETVDPLRAAYGREFRLLEIVSVMIFSVEYFARLWSGVEGLDENGAESDRVEWHPIVDRVRIAIQPMMLVDLLAILPFYLAMAGLGLDLRFLRALRLIRFLRLLKMVRYSDTMRAFGHAFKRKQDELIVAMTANALLLVVASSLMYFIEHEIQPEAFGSIPETMWWGIVTLTTVGYGDVAPITPLGRVLGSVVAVLGIGLFALPASIMASGFVEESSYETRYCPDYGHEIDWATDIESPQATFEDGEEVRIDVSAGSDVPYRHHGDHGTITEVPEGADGTYVVDLHASKKDLEADWTDLRAPLPLGERKNG